MVEANFRVYTINSQIKKPGTKFGKICNLNAWPPLLARNYLNHILAFFLILTFVKSLRVATRSLTFSGVGSGS